MTIYSLDVLLFLFGTSLLFHVHLTVASWPTYRCLRRQIRWGKYTAFFKFLGYIIVMSLHSQHLCQGTGSYILRKCCHVNKLSSSHNFVFHRPWNTGTLGIQFQMYHPGSCGSMLIRCQFLWDNNYPLPSLIGQALPPLEMLWFNSINNIVIRKYPNAGKDWR